MEGTSTATTTHNTSLQLIKKRIKSLQKKYKRLNRKEESLAQGESLSQQDIRDAKLRLFIRLEELHNLNRVFGVGHQEQLSSNPHLVHASTNSEAREPVGMAAACTRACPFQKLSSLNESEEIMNSVPPLDKERYLCVSDGFVVYCLDLKTRKDGSKGLQPLPKISTLKLLDNDLPVSMGLLMMGSDLFMVSGQEFPGFKKHADLNLPYWLYEKYGFKGSSRKAYHLSLVDYRLSLSECYSFPPLKKPKFWPIVVKFGDQIHVIESIPSCLPRPETIPSHDVLNLNKLTCGWSRLSPMRYPDNEGIGMFICDHLVIDDLIYARTYDSCVTIVVFDSKTNKWGPRDEYSTNHVMDNWDLAYYICTGEFMNAESGEPLYVVIGIGDVSTSEVLENEDMEMVAVAHLVLRTGQVVCTQNLPHFFEGLKEPSFITEATMFSVDEQTLCVVVLGTSTRTWQDFIFISTYTVETFAPKPDISKVFVNVVSKDWHVYKLGTDLRGEGSKVNLAPRLSVCFM